MEKLESAIAKIEVNDNTFENTGTEIFPSYINFFFGANGVGKSTLAQMIRDDSGVIWKKGMSRDAYNVLVYNQDFIERNFSNFDNLAGVFTVHEKNIADQKKQEELKAKLKECEESGAALNKEHEKAATVLEKATEKFHDTCWSRTAFIREQFEQVFKGKGRKKLIADAILEVESPAEQARRKILCKRFSTKSRMALENRADSGLDPLITESHGGQNGMCAGTA